MLHKCMLHRVIDDPLKGTHASNISEKISEISLCQEQDVEHFEQEACN